MAEIKGGRWNKELVSNLRMRVNSALPLGTLSWNRIIAMYSFPIPC